MCGIAGLILKNNTSAYTYERYEKEVSRMEHRGPDHFGRYQGKGLMLFHFRLSIIDLSKNAHQPFSLGEEGNQLIYNGELYNFQELIERYNLTQTTQSDTEVLFKTFQNEGFSILPEYNGIFAFAFYNKKNNRIEIARDRLGVKPLYYIDHKDFFAFASEAKVLYNYLEELKINFQALHEFMWYGSSISSQTIVQGVKKLEPSTLLSYDLNTHTFKKEKFWTVKKNIIDTGEIKDSYIDAQKKALYLLEEGVKRQCVSDVEVGAYLSGGIDSSTVVALASKHTKGKLNTFSVAFDKNPNSELPLARLVAKKYNSNHHEFEVSTKNLEDDLASIIYQYDEPFADPAAIPLHLMAQQNKEKTRVILQGDGGDELFAGYGRHLDLTELKKRQLGSYILSKLAPNKHMRKAMGQRSWALNATTSWERMARQVANYLPQDPIHLFREQWLEELKDTNPYNAYQKVNNDLLKLDSLQSMLYTDMQLILPHTYLEKVDKINMFHSIEARVPLLDNDLVDYVMRLPSKFKIRNGVTKSFLREIVADLLPVEVLNGRKMSFGTPMGEWIKSSLYLYVKDLFFKSSQVWGHIFNIDYLIEELEKHKENKVNNEALLWRATVLLIWLNFYQKKIDF